MRFEYGGLFIGWVAVVVSGRAALAEEPAGVHVAGAGGLAMAETAEPSVTDEGGEAGLGFAIAPRVGLNLPTSRLGAFAVVGLELDLLLPVLERRLILALDASYTFGSYDGAGADPRVGGDYTYEIGQKELKLALDLVFRLFTEDRPVIPYLGAGLVLHLLETVERTSFGPPVDHRERSTELGFELIGGVDISLGPGFLLVDLRWVHSDLDHDLTGDTNAGNVTLALGYRYLF